MTRFYPGAPQQSGLLLVDTVTGKATRVDFGTVQHSAELPRLTEWGAAGHLLAQRRLPGVDRDTFCIINTLGQVISSAVLEAASMQMSGCWAPDGSAAMLTHLRGVWIWAPGAGTQPVWTDIVGQGCLHECCWSFHSRALLACKVPLAQLVIWTPGQEQHLQAPPCAATDVHDVFWGNGHAAVLCNMRAVGCLGREQAVSRTVVFCTATGAGVLSPLRTLAGETSYTCPACGWPLSPCGRLLCLATARSTAAAREQHGIDIFDMATGHLLQRRALQAKPARVTWASNGARLLVSDSDGHSNGTLLIFAGDD